jgi:endonuclease-3
MRPLAISVVEVLHRLESRYGAQKPRWPTEPYEFLIWWHCGYPASDAACARGWKSVQEKIGIEPQQILAAPTPELASALKPGGMVPELRAVRLKEIAARIKDEFGGDLRGGLIGPLKDVRKSLKRFPGVADPGADRILLFGGIAAVAAVPSNCPHVLVRIERGQEGENYGVTYKEAQQAIQAEVPETFDARARAYLLLKKHGQDICKRTTPLCNQCAVSAACVFFAGKHRGRGRLTKS